MNGHALWVGIVTGLAATATLDIGSLFGMLLGIPGKGPRLNGFDMIGRWVGYIFRGRFRHTNIKEEPALPGEVPLGILCHYYIATFLTLLYLEASKLLRLPTGVITALVFGVLTNIFPWFLMFPSQGFGWLGRKAPAGAHLTRTSFWNQLFFGGGIALWTTILKPIQHRNFSHA